MEADMSAKWSDLEGFLARPTTLTLERILVMDYLLSRGFLPCDLRYLPPKQAAALFAEACRFARLNLDKIEPKVEISSYIPVGFSLN
jgi:hypothetical protein